MRYWDTSTIVKTYVSEPESALLCVHMTATGIPVSSELLRWEFYTTVIRKEADGDIAAGAAEKIFQKFIEDVAAKKIKLIPFDFTVEDRFRKIIQRLHGLSPRLVVRTLDGIHVATADLQSTTEFVTTDTNMRKCAAALGLKLFP